MEGPEVHVRRADHRGEAVDDDALGVQDGRSVLEDPHAPLEQVSEDAVPRMPHERDVARPGRRSRTSTPRAAARARIGSAPRRGAKYAFVSQKVLRAAAPIAARTEAVSSCPRPGLESRTRIDAPGGARLVRRRELERRDLEGLPARAVPAFLEDDGHLPRGGPLEPGVRVAPQLRPAALEGRAVLVADVHAAREGHAPVRHEDLAVVAVRLIPEEGNRAVIEMHLDVSLFHLPPELRARVARAERVGEDAHGDAAPGGGREGSRRTRGRSRRP